MHKSFYIFDEDPCNIVAYFFKSYFLVRASLQAGRLNPGGFLPNAQCLGVEEKVARSSPSHSSAQPSDVHVSGESGPWSLLTILPVPIRH